MLYHCVVCVSPPLIEFHSIDNKTWELSHPLLNTKYSCPGQILLFKMKYCARNLPVQATAYDVSIVFLDTNHFDFLLSRQPRSNNFDV